MAADPVQGANFLALVQAVRSKLGDKRLLLTTALPANPAVLQHIDLPAAAQALDFMNLQTYNMHLSLPGRSICPSQLYSLAKDEPSTSMAAGYLVSRSFPAQKILLGIPTFGTTFPGCDGPAQAYDPASSRPVDYLGLPVEGRQEGTDRRRISAYCAGGIDGFIAYDNPETVREKADFCKQKGYGVRFACAKAHPMFDHRAKGIVNASSGTILLRRLHGRGRPNEKPHHGGFRDIA